MRAAVMWEPGEPFAIDEVEIAPPGPGQVAVAIDTCGMCASDLALTTAFGQPTPAVLGHEGAGTITEIGAGTESVAVGDHVVVLWVAPCGHCPACRRGDEYLCANRKSSADRAAGRTLEDLSPLSVGGQTVHQGMATATFAQATVLPAGAVVRIDDDVPFSVAAMMGCAVPTGVGAALRSARVAPGDDVAVIGCGAVGLNAVMGAVVAGAAQVIAVDPTPARRETALAVGATQAIDPERFGETAGELDVCIDAVGQPATVASAWRSVRRGGTITVVGAGRRDQVVELSAYELFHDDKRLTGSFHGGINMRHDLPMLVGLWRAGRLPIERLIDGTADLGDINEVARAQRAGDVVRTLITTGG